VRAGALQEARRVCEVRKENVRRYRKPNITWKKFKRNSKTKVVVALHDTLPVWIRGEVKEFTTCRDNLVILHVEKDVFMQCEELKPRKGWPRKIKEVMAVPLKDLWVIDK